MPQEPFYMISLAEAKRLYAQRCITAKGLFLIYLRIKLPSGQSWQLQRSAQQLAEELGLGLKTIYKLLGAMPQGFKFWIPASTKLFFSRESPTGESNSPTGESESPTGESNSPTGESESPTGENHGLDSLPGEDSSTSIDSYKTFINSLSDSEREGFLRFVETETRLLKIASLHDWLAAPDKSGQFRYLGFWQKYSRPAPAPQGPAPMPAAPEPEPEPVDPEETRRALAKAKEEYPWLFRAKSAADERGSGRRGRGGGFIPGVRAVGDAIGGLLDGLGGQMEATT